ncbi:MAG: TlpA disulfide reductase family protein [Bdellovibrionota bacterium]
MALLALALLLTRIQLLDSSQANSIEKNKAPSFSAPLIKDEHGLPVKKIADAGAFHFDSSKLDSFYLLNFWASWCQVCASEKAYLEQLYIDLDRHIKIVGVVTYDEYDALLRSGKMNRIPYKLIFDKAGNLAAKFSVGSLPNSVLISPDGSILKVVFGALNPKMSLELTQLIQKNENRSF